MKKRINLDSSALGLLKCPRLFNYVVIEGYKPKILNNDLVWGKSIHEGFAEYYRLKMRINSSDGNVVLSETEMADLATTKALLFFKENNGKNIPPKSESSIEQILRFYLPKDDFHPLKVEEYWEQKIDEDDEYEYYLCGKVDAIGIDPVEGMVIKEIKTSKTIDLGELYNYYSRSHQAMIYSRYASNLVSNDGHYLPVLFDFVVPRATVDKFKRMRPAVSFQINIYNDIESMITGHIKILKTQLKEGLFPKNYAVCKDFFSKMCPFWDACTSPDKVAIEVLERNFVMEPYEPKNH